jgi:hypothetical protein
MPTYDLLGALDELSTALGPDAARYEPAILQESYLFRVSPFWLILAYAIISLGELMLSPMGLSLVSKVAPIRMRGLLMGGDLMRLDSPDPHIFAYGVVAPDRSSAIYTVAFIGQSEVM